MNIPQDSEIVKLEEQLATIAKELYRKGIPTESLKGYIAIAIDEIP